MLDIGSFGRAVNLFREARHVQLLSAQSSLRDSARVCFVVFAALTATVLLACGNEAPPRDVPVDSTAMPTTAPIQTGAANATPLPTYTPEPTYTAVPTYTPVSRYTPTPVPMTTPEFPATVEVTREVPVTVEVTREVPVTVEVVREIEIEVEKEVVREVPVIVEVVREIVVEKVVEVPVTVVPTTGPPTPSFVPFDADLVIYLWKLENVGFDDQIDSFLVASAKANFDIPTDRLEVVVTRRDSGRTINFQNCDSRLFESEVTELGCVIDGDGGPGVLEESLEVIVGVRVQTPQGRTRCERNQNSTIEELIYNCEL